MKLLEWVKLSSEVIALREDIPAVYVGMGGKRGTSRELGEDGECS